MARYGEMGVPKRERYGIPSTQRQKDRRMAPESYSQKLNNLKLQHSSYARFSMFLKDNFQSSLIYHYIWN